MPKLFLVILIYLAVGVINATLYENCMSAAVCRNLYGQSAFLNNNSVDPHSTGVLTYALGQNVSLVRFEREMESRELKMEVLLGALPLDISERIELYEAILIKALLDESKCPPNSYWSWSPEEKKHICRCFIDRDCRTSTTTICHDTTHPAIFILLAFASLLLLIDIVVRIVTDRYQNP